MKKPYLIQRGRTKDIQKKDIHSFDDFLNLEYMGSSEFEWGVLPRSLNRMIEDLEKYRPKNIGIQTFEEKTLYLFAKAEEIGEAKKYVIQMAEDELITKEFVGMKNAIENGRFHDGKRNFWWDIDNDFFVIVGKENAKKLVYSMQQTRLKKQKLCSKRERESQILADKITKGPTYYKVEVYDGKGNYTEETLPVQNLFIMKDGYLCTQSEEKGMMHPLRGLVVEKNGEIKARGDFGGYLGSLGQLDLRQSVLHWNKFTDTKLDRPNIPIKSYWTQETGWVIAE